MFLVLLKPDDEDKKCGYKIMTRKNCIPYISNFSNNSAFLLLWTLSKVVHSQCVRHGMAIITSEGVPSNGVAWDSAGVNGDHF